MNKRKKLVSIITPVTAAVIIFCVVYSRGVYQRRLPLVYITLSQTQSFFQIVEAVSAVRPAEGAAKTKNFGYMSRAVISLEDYPWCVENDTFFMRLGDSMSVRTPSKRFVMTGEIVEIQIEGSEVLVTVGFQPGEEGLIIDETAYLTFERLNEDNHCMVPASSVFHDGENGGDYIYLVTKRSGFWGSKYVLVRENVEFTALRRVGGYMLLDRESQLTQPVVMWSDKELADGARVRIYD